MHYYQFNIGDYRKDTGHLSLLEHGIYRSLIDSYYLNEGGLLADDAKLMRTHSIRTEVECNAYKNVINDFFREDSGYYINDKCDGVMGKIFDKSQKARESAQKRWDKQANGMRTHSDGNANGMLPINPIPNTHIPKVKTCDQSKIDQQDIDDAFEIFWSSGIRKVNKKNSKPIFAKIVKSKKLGSSILQSANFLCNDIKKRIESNQLGFAETHPTTYLNGERWNDDIKQQAASDERTYQTATDRARSDGQRLLDEQRAAQDRNTDTQNYPLI